MKKWTFLFAGFFMLACNNEGNKSAGSKVTFSDLVAENLKGDISSIEETPYQTDSTGKIGAMDSCCIALTEYDENGNVVKYTTKDSKGTLKEEGTITRYENGMWKGQKNMKDGKIINSIETSMDDKGMYTGALAYDSTGKLEFYYTGLSQNEQGQITSWKQYDKDSVFRVEGANTYDKLMLGAFITNIKLPPSDFQFLLAPMYAFGSKRLSGLGLAYYSFYPSGIFKSIDIGISGSTFTADQFTDETGNKTSLSFHKIVPGIRLTLKEKNPLSYLNRYFQFKSFRISEDGLRFYRDTVVTGVDTIISNKYSTISESRTLNQLKLVIENNRVLYPYRGELNVEQGKYFIRTAFTGKYFFNYVKEGGLDVRFFAGKFFYTGSKTVTKQFATDRYHLNLTGANGYEDYTYSDYFAGRNKFEGFASQQIMVRDGAFKVRTDLLADKVGKTDDWLIAANFSTTVPSSINPLNLLPVKIPLKLFFDIGTYAETWKQNAETDRFLFDAGLHIPLLKETVNIYIPLLYSRIYRDYLQSTIPKKERLWKKICLLLCL